MLNLQVRKFESWKLQLYNGPWQLNACKKLRPPRKPPAKARATRRATKTPQTHAWENETWKGARLLQARLGIHNKNSISACSRNPRAPRILSSIKVQQLPRPAASAKRRGRRASS